ncbi:MAG TPA: carboxypeptidase-like regulatory domain-containing protein, partial [Candidatus Angelobacter sp.]
MKRGFAFVMFTLVLFLSCNSASAQSSSAEAQLNGSVRDQTGSVIAKAAVALRNVDTNQTYKTTSNNVGFYILPNVPPGNYELTAESQGFA